MGDTLGETSEEEDSANGGVSGLKVHQKVTVWGGECPLKPYKFGYYSMLDVKTLWSSLHNLRKSLPKAK